MTGSRPPRIVVADTGPGDGAEASAHALRDAGAEVVWVAAPADSAQRAGLLATIAVQEDADLLVVPGADADLLAAVRDELGRRGAAEVPVRGGGEGAAELLDALAAGSQGAS